MEQLLKRIKGKAVRTFRNNEERWLGKTIIKKSLFAAPDFMIIGAAKAGTTSLFQYLAQHPEIIPTSRKEIKYFGMGRRRKGLKWYLNHFPTKDKMKNKMTFEATPTYLYRKRSPKEIRALFPDMKFIAILRDPVKRTFSHWTWYQEHSKVKNRTLLDNRSFPEAVHEELNDPQSVPWIHKYIERGLYAQQLKEWYRYFKPEQILLIDFEELKGSPKKVLKNLANFLEIRDVYDDFEESEERVQGVLATKDLGNNRNLKTYNASVYRERMDENTEQILRKYYAIPDRELKELTGRSFSWMIE